MTASRFTDEEKMKCAEREVALRRNVYPRRVERELMPQQMADREIAMMREIAEDYRKRCELPL